MSLQTPFSNQIKKKRSALYLTLGMLLVAVFFATSVISLILMLVFLMGSAIVEISVKR